MKRYLLGLFAVVLAVGLSSFSSMKKANNTTSYYWFQIADGYNLNTAVLKADAEFLDFGATNPDGIGCDAISNQQCVSGFAESDVQLKSGSEDEYELINDMQSPEVTARKRP